MPEDKQDQIHKSFIELLQQNDINVAKALEWEKELLEKLTHLRKDILTPMLTNRIKSIEALAQTIYTLRSANLPQEKVTPFIEALLERPLSDFDFSQDTLAMLKHIGVVKISTLLYCEEYNLRTTHGFDEKTMQEIKAILAYYKLYLGMKFT